MAISYQDVCKAAEQLKKRNISVSVRSVREITRGSNSHIAPLVDQWRKDNPSGQFQLPEKISRAISEHFNEIQENHESDLKEEIERYESLQEEIEGLRSDLIQATNKRVEAELFKDAETRRAESFESRCLELESKLRQREDELIAQRVMNQGLQDLNATLNDLVKRSSPS